MNAVSCGQYALAIMESRYGSLPSEPLTASELSWQMEGELCVILGGCDVTVLSEAGGMCFDVREGTTNKAPGARGLRQAAPPA